MNDQSPAHILVIDDEEDNVSLLQALLHNEGYSTEVAYNGREALALARARLPDLIVSDVLMPVMDGFTLCQEIRADSKLKNQPLIFYTATYIDARDEKLALSLGANQYVIKPQEPRRLLKIIRDLLEQNKRGELVFNATLKNQPAKTEEYSHVLVRKLEEKMTQLEQAKSSLENNVRELQATTRTLEASEDRFRGFARIAADWFFETDAELVIQYVSRPQSSKKDLDWQALVGKHLLDILCDGQIDQHRKVIYEKLANRQIVNGHESLQRTPTGTRMFLRCSGEPYLDSAGEFLGYRVVALDITESHALTQQLSYQATHDSLTNLVNRWEFNRRINRMLSKIGPGTEHVLCYLDIDQFKIINDTSGHFTGDLLLKKIGEALSERVRERDTLARLGGDEFAILMEHCNVQQASRLAQEVCDTIRNLGFSSQEREFKVTASLGLVKIGSQDKDLASILSAADVACYAAKNQGGDRIHIYRHDDADVERWYGDMEWAQEINHALAEDRFVLYAQSIVPVNQSSQSTKRYEILVRMLDRKGDLVLPGHFLPAAEKYHLMQKVDRWVVERLFAWMRENPQVAGKEIDFCVNLSGVSLGDEVLLAYLLEQFNSGIDPKRICFEITETSAVAKYIEAQDFISRLRNIGCWFAIDDFGSGVCSFAYLQQFQIDAIKIDGQFIQDINRNPISRTVVNSINEISHHLGVKTVAEFIENEAIRETLESIGIDYMQGYLIDRPGDLRKLK